MFRAWERCCAMCDVVAMTSVTIVVAQRLFKGGSTVSGLLIKSAFRARFLLEQEGRFCDDSSTYRLFETPSQSVRQKDNIRVNCVTTSTLTTFPPLSRRNTQDYALRKRNISIAALQRRAKTPRSASRSEDDFRVCFA